MDDVNFPITTGRFGTDFLTTYLLSKNVEVKGVFHHIDKLTQQTSFRKFSLSLRRDAQDLEHMTQLN